MDQGAQFQIVLVDETSTPTELPENPSRPTPDAAPSRPSVPTPSEPTQQPEPAAAPSPTKTDRPEAQVADTATPAKGQVDRNESVTTPRYRDYYHAQRLSPGYAAAIGVADSVGLGHIARAMIGTFEAVKAVALQLELQRKESEKAEADLSAYAARRMTSNETGDADADGFPDVIPVDSPVGLEEEPEAFDQTLENAIGQLDDNTDPRHLSKLGDRIVAALRPGRTGPHETAKSPVRQAGQESRDPRAIPTVESAEAETKPFPTAGTGTEDGTEKPYLVADIGKPIDFESFWNGLTRDALGDEGAKHWQELGKTTDRIPEPKKPIGIPTTSAKGVGIPDRPETSSEQIGGPKSSKAKTEQPATSADPVGDTLQSWTQDALGKEGAKHWEALGKTADRIPDPKKPIEPTAVRKSWGSMFRSAPKPATQAAATPTAAAPKRVMAQVVPTAARAAAPAAAATGTAAATGVGAANGTAAATGSTALLAAAGPVTIAFAAIAAAAVGVGLAFKMVNDAARSQADQLEQYSAAISKQRAETGVRRQLRDIERANERGETLAKVGGAQDRLQEAFMKLGDSLVDPLIDILASMVPMIEGAAYGITKTAEGISIGVDNVKLIAAYVNDWMGLAGTEAEQNSRVREAEKKLAEGWKEFLSDEKKERLAKAIKDDPLLDMLNNAWGQQQAIDPQLMREMIAALRSL